MNCMHKELLEFHGKNSEPKCDKLQYIFTYPVNCSKVIAKRLSIHIMWRVKFFCIWTKAMETPFFIKQQRKFEPKLNLKQID